MTEAEAISIYRDLDTKEQLGLLLNLAAWLTVCARETYVAGSSDVADAPRLREYNELQHRVLEHCVHLFKGDTKRYPDDVIMGTIWGFAEFLHFESFLTSALQEAAGRALQKSA